jgi:hypothetical protein
MVVLMPTTTDQIKDKLNFGIFYENPLRPLREKTPISKF